MKPNTIYHGDCLEVMKEWPAERVDMVVTSPPYWKLRDYGVNGQLGLEKTPEEYIEKLVDIFREVRRVLKPWGTVWVNMGDNHASGKGSCRNPGGGASSLGKKRKEAGAHPLHRGNVSDLRRVGLKPQELCGIPGRLVLALQADGWWRKSDIIWYKPAPMPESVNGWRWERHRIKIEKGKPRTQKYGKARLGMQDHSGYVAFGGAKHKDCSGCLKCEKHKGLVLRKGSGRPSTSYEYIFLLAKSGSYFYDTEAVRQRQSEATLHRFRAGQAPRVTGKKQATSPEDVKSFETLNGILPSGRNLRDVWTINTQPYPEAHYATFPEELPRRCILAGTSAKGNCAECGKPWVRVVETESRYEKREPAHTPNSKPTKVDSSGWLTPIKTYRGWLPSCDCNADIVPAIVLDPFFGSGTVGKVATSLSRNWIGIEISKDYIEKQAKLRTAMRGFHELTA